MIPFPYKVLTLIGLLFAARMDETIQMAKQVPIGT
jgi:hypothetical protein